jgi:hypothetical protein
MIDLMAVLAEGHNHAPGEPCDAYLGEEDGRYGFGVYNMPGQERVRTYRICLDRCPFDEAGPEAFRHIELAEWVMVDARALDIERSSACDVELIWGMASWLARSLH